MKPPFTSVSRKTDMHGSYVTFMPVQSTEMSNPAKNQNVNFIGRLVSESARTFKHPLTQCLKRKENRSTSGQGAGASYQTSHPGLIYSKEKSFYLPYGKHWSRRLQTVRTRPAKSKIHTCMHRVYFISNFRITARANVFTAKVHSIYRYILNT